MILSETSAPQAQAKAERQALGPRLRRAKLAGLALVLALPVASRAADLPPSPPAVVEPLPPAPSGLEFSLTLYGWASGIYGKVRTLPPLPTVKINLPFDKVLQHLDGGLMGAAELKSGRFLLLTDFIAAKISGGKEFGRSIAGIFLGTGIKVESTTITGLAAAGYRVIDDPRYVVDGFVGVRGFNADNVLTLDFVRLPSINYGKTESWAAPAVGGRVRFGFADNWYFSTIGFVGGTDPKSNYFWDVFSGVGYAFNERYSVFLGYRAMKVDYRNGNFLYNVIQQGPVTGLNIRF
jgi:hypothetical protein